ncbi:uncharacterized protein LOC113278965 [Papaver somniferum]|uniref:uncharacterized protein LOC113278965 n=1 Tax=Papaver somniferum TaxID=3469 RepID=UPI000E6FF839|nr:uncharacterized protein LOC113278965 [Papaver somniferum]
MNLRKVPLYLWNELGLSKIASIVGTPIMTDTPTALKTRMSYVRVLVEVAADCGFPSNLHIQVDNENFIVKAEYSWKPDACSHYKNFGDSSAKCSSKVISFLHCTSPVNTEDLVVQSNTGLIVNTRDREEITQDRIEQISLVAEVIKNAEGNCSFMKFRECLEA